MTYETQDTTELVKYFSNWYVFHESGIREAFPIRFAYHQWRNVEGLVKKSPLGGKKSPLRGAPRSRVYLEQFVKKWPKNLNK